MWVGGLDVSEQVFGDGEREDGDAETFDVGEDGGAASDGGGSGDDVVYDEDVFVAEGMVFVQNEGVFHVFLALQEGELGLTFAVVAAPDGVCVEGNAGVEADALGNLFALVVATVYPAFAGDGNGHYHIDTVEEMGLVESVDHDGGDVEADLGAVVVFEVKDDVALTGFVVVDEEGCGAPYGHFEPEEALEGVALAAVGIFCGRELKEAVYADALL